MHQQRIVVVGAGIIGLSTAYALLKQGIRHVTVLEQAVVDHQRGASHGCSRLLRFEYGANLLYTQLVQLSLAYWKTLEQVSRRSLYTPTGLLTLGNEDDNFTQPSYHILRELGLPTKRLTLQACQQLFPQFDTHGYEICTYNQEGGILHASACLRTLKELILELGGQIHEARRVIHILHDHIQRPIRLVLNSGDEYKADRVVLALGPWINHLLEGLRLPIQLTRQYLLYFTQLPIAEFGVPIFPGFLADELYGFPIHDSYTGKGSGWFKAASHTFGIPVDPEDTPLVDEHLIAQTVSRICALLPAVRQATLARVESCIYDVSPDEGFILDTLPYDPRIVFATGLSGHGFKFGLVLGELLSSLVRDVEPPVLMERFRLARFSQSYSKQNQFSVA